MGDEVSVTVIATGLTADYKGDAISTRGGQMEYVANPFERLMNTEEDDDLAEIARLFEKKNAESINIDM
jgi:hypothetical protein